jgi:transcriptional regulator with XRE-family HTH domain
MNNNILGERIKALRIAKGLSQEEFADELNDFSRKRAETHVNQRDASLSDFLEVYNSLDDESQKQIRSYMELLAKDK